MRNHILLLFAFINATLFAQTNYSDWQKVYSDNTTTVEVSFAMNSNSCNGAKNKFRYRIIGSLSREPRYVNWKMIYKDCYNHPVYLLNSVSIGQDAELNKPIESNDYSFSGTWLADKFKIYKPTAAANPYSNLTPQALPNDWGVGIISAVITGRKTVCAGESVYLTSKVVDTTSTVIYQWQSSADGKTWTNLAGKTTSDCRTAEINSTTSFRCVCKDEATGAEMNSNELTIAVVEPVVTVSGTSSVCKGGSAALTASANDGVTGATYRWQISEDKSLWKEIEGATSATFTSTALNEQTFFRCVYKPGSGFCAATTSEVFLVNVGQTSSVTATGNITICQGGIAELSSSTTDKNEGTYQWQSSTDHEAWNNLKLGVAEHHTTEPLFTTTFFRVLFTPNVSGCGVTISNELTITVAEVPQVIAKGNTTILSEKSVPLKAKGNWSLGDANYQWQESNNEKNWKDLTGATAPTIHSPKITSTTFYRCIYQSPISGCIGTSNTITVTMPLKKEKVEHYSDEKFWVPRLHNPKKLMHIGIDAGFGFNLQPLRVLSSQLPDSAVSLSAKALGLHAGFIFHPVMKDFCSVGFSLSGDVGTTPLLFAGGKSKTVRETYLASKLNAGTEIAFGYWALKVLFKYNLSMQTHKLNRTENVAGNFSINTSFRKEIIGVGFRVGPYAARKRNNIPYNVDFLVTVANDYKFNYGGAWSYQSLSGWQIGFETGVWLQSYFKLGFGMSFYDGGKVYLFPDGKNHTTAFLTLTYARDWFK